MGYDFHWEARSSSVDETNHIYYPQLFRHLDDGIEALLEDAGYPIYRLIRDEERALPIVHAEADYLDPIEFGDSVDCTITPDAGESSVEFRGKGTVDGRRVFEATIVRVFVDLETFEKRPLPDGMRTQLATFS